MRLKEKKGLKPPCERCDRPVLNPNNTQVLNIWYRYGSGMCGSDGLNILAVDKVMDYEGVPLCDRPLLSQKITLWGNIILNKRMGV